ncbi:flagellin N-terminal helical domain-containing protein [Tepidibacter aestuarii]|uniref:flagellin N-terminal helical domain-containing protein n=1 Tax=Tepidibacter aestuarii TaxID=2925782 RepID=UPI002076B02E|nr:flagellin [Tepidibacter aestuarii]CAH2211883.1 flagellin protein [Tepidibacter aestuarii]
MIINHNMNAMNAHRNMGMANASQAKSIEKLSSGLRINRAGDDAAGLAISEKMRGQIRGLDQASRNAQDGISLIQTAEGALNETQAILQRVRELTVQASNDTNVSEDRAQIAKEVEQLTNEIDRIANTTEFNTKNLLSGGLSGTNLGATLQIGANDGQNISVQIKRMNASALTSTATTGTLASVQTLIKAGAGGNSISNLLTGLDTAISNVSAQRASLGAFQNRLEHTIKNLDNASENLQGAESRIRDVDMAKEMMNMNKLNILNQASQSMLAQANQQPQGVLQLLR